MQIPTKILMHTIKHIRVLCHYANKTYSDDKKRTTNYNFKTSNWIKTKPVPTVTDIVRKIPAFMGGKP